MADHRRAVGVTALTAVSLFAGVGGFDLALERAGVRVAAAVEIDAGCRGVLSRHFPATTLMKDITEVTGDDLRAAGFVPGRGIVTAGWPCQGNSSAGARGGMGDPRSGLWRHVVRLVAETRPRWFVGENVPGLLSVNYGEDIAVVRGDIAQLGYWWTERILDAQYFGVPQRRRRLFFVGHSGDRAAPVQVLLESEGSRGNPAAGAASRADVAGTLGSRAGGGRTTDLDGHGAYVIGTLGTTSPGGGWRIGADEAAAGQLVATLQGGGQRGYRIDAEGAAGNQLIPLDRRPAATIAGTLTAASAGVSQPGRRTEDDRSLASAAEGVRRLTPRECERLQGFPDDWTRRTADGSEQPDSARYRQMGNAVAAPVAEWICRRLVAADSGDLR